MNGAQGIDRRGFLRLLWPVRREPPAPGSDDAETPGIPDASSDIAPVAIRAAGDQATAAALARRALGPMALPAEAPTSLHLRWLAAAAQEPPARPHAELDPGRCLALTARSAPRAPSAAWCPAPWSSRWAGRA
jgi:hypothetical protein